MPAESIQPMFPWFEANQGFLSFAALIAAFAIAIFELRRAERVTTDAKDDDVHAAVAIIDGVFNVARGVRANFVDEKFVPGLARSLTRDMQQAARQLDIVALKCSNVDLVSLVTTAAGYFRKCRSNATTFEQLEADIRKFEDKLAPHRTILINYHFSPLKRKIWNEIRIEQMRPRPDDDRD